MLLQSAAMFTMTASEQRSVNVPLRADVEGFQACQIATTISRSPPGLREDTYTLELIRTACSYDRVPAPAELISLHFQRTRSGQTTHMIGAARSTLSCPLQFPRTAFHTTNVCACQYPLDIMSEHATNDSRLNATKDSASSYGALLKSIDCDYGLILNAWEYRRSCSCETILNLNWKKGVSRQFPWF